MGCWGYQFDQNDHVQDMIASLETEGIKDTCEPISCNCCCSFCDMGASIPTGTAKFNSFEKLINLDTLRKNEILTILGVLLNYARRDTADILGGSPFEINFPDKLPKGYPEVYKELAIEKIEEYDEFILGSDSDFYSLKIFEEFMRVKKLFLSS